MHEKKEFEIIMHTTMKYLEIFLVEMTTRVPHGHDDFEIGILLEGDLSIFIENEPYELHAGDIFIINRYQVHSFLSKNSRNRILAFQIHTDFYRRINYQLGFLYFKDNIFRSGVFYDNLYETLLSCADCYFSASEHKDLKCSSILFDALYRLLNNGTYTMWCEKATVTAQNNTLRLNRMTEYILEHFNECLSLQDIAELEKISKYHASHFIKKMLGISFQEYLNQLRFEHALQIMRNSTLSILDICIESGFSSSKYLNQMFQKNFGCSAREYSKMKEKPYLTGVALPTGNIENRYSFEQSAFLYSKLTNRESPSPSSISAIRLLAKPSP
jgi:AraC-like DNA-binding protein/mannose-6-phosphate isomerase-like protein (cupin superfamily)